MELSIRKACTGKNFNLFSTIVRSNIPHFTTDDWHYFLNRICLSNSADISLVKELSQHIRPELMTRLMGQVDKRTLFRLSAMISIIENDFNGKCNSYQH